MRVIHFNSLRKRLLFIFLSFTLLITIVAILSIYFYNKSTKLANITHNIDALLIESMQMMKQEKDFLKQELKNIDFYETGKSKYIEKHAEISSKLKEKLYVIINNNGLTELEANDEKALGFSKKTLYELENYAEDFTHFVELIRLRGFKDKGLEGKMRKDIHQVESKLPNHAPILSLRRREKDYLLRRDLSYAHQLEKECKTLVNSNILSDKEKNNLKNYLSSFQQIVKIEQVIYAKNGKGLQGKLNHHSEMIISNLDKLSKEVGKKSLRIKAVFKNILIFSLIAIISISIILSYYLSYQIAKPIKQLSKEVHQQLEEKILQHKPSQAPLSADEVERLNTDFKEIIENFDKKP